MYVQKCPNCDRRSGCTANCEDCGRVLCTECAPLEVEGRLTCQSCLDDLLTPGDDGELSEVEHGFTIQCGMHSMHVSKISGGYVIVCGTATVFDTETEAQAVLDWMACTEHRHDPKMYQIRPVAAEFHGRVM